MSKTSERKAQSNGLTEKPSEKPTVRVPQPHGGYLVPGAGGGPRPGSGRKRSLIREDVLLSFDTKARAFLDDVVSGELVSRMRIPVKSAAKHLTCPKCGGKEGALVPSDPALADVEVEVEVSASVNQRLTVAEMMMRYGLGQMKELSADAVRDRLDRTLDELQTMLSPEQYIAVCQRLEPIWV